MELSVKEQRVVALPNEQLQHPLHQIVVCALLRRIDSPGEIPGRRTVVPAGSPWGDSGGDEWVEALQEKAVYGRSVNHAGRSV